MLQVVPNGGRKEGVPVGPGELAAAVRAAVVAGADDVHLHPRDGAGAETMDPAAVAAVVAAIRTAAPGIPVGVTTAAWVEPDPAIRAELVQRWTVLPDHASVNFHEDGAELVAEALLECGIGIEAGIFSGTEGAARFLAWPSAPKALRVLAEIVDDDPDTPHRLLAELGDAAGVPLLLHGEDASAWPVLELAVSLGLHTRIGLEDTSYLPDGTPAADNADLVRAARRLA